MLLFDNISTLVTVCPVASERYGSANPDLSLKPLGTPLCGEEMGNIGVMYNAAVAVEGDAIVWIGDSDKAPAGFSERIDCTGKTILPGFVDSHTHMVFAGDRADEFARRLRGVTYQEIAAAGGGILKTVRSVRDADIAQIADIARLYVRSAFKHGSTTIEIKSGYGLNYDNELKLLYAIKELQQSEMPSIVATFLGAHDVPVEFKNHRSTYIDHIIRYMIPAVAEQQLAEYCDVFSDIGYFTPDETEKIFAAARKHGLRLKLHADELASYGGAELAARSKAVSADHLLRISDHGIRQMKEAGVIATLLPGTAFFLGLPYAPARKMISKGLPIALATDCNPGSNLSENMQMTIVLACMGMKMTMEEAISAATINGAAALNRAHEIGSLEIGKKADMIICDAPDYPHLIYHYGINHVETVVKNGVVYDVKRL